MNRRTQPMQAAAFMCAALVSLPVANVLAQAAEDAQREAPGAGAQWPAIITTQSAESHAQQVIVKWKEQLPRNGRAAAAARALADAQARHGIILRATRKIATGGEVIGLDRNLSRSELNALLDTLQSDPAIEYVEEDRVLKPLFTPNDAEYAQQWHYFEAAGGLNLPAAWDIATGAGVRVAVLDTGYRPHADLAGNIVGGYDFISNSFTANDGGGRDSDALDPGDGCGFQSSWHGTHVAGTVAAVTHNGAGVAGVAFGAKVVPVRVLGCGGGNISDISDAIIWASGGGVSGVPANLNPARVINLSLGGGGACGPTTQTAINQARSRGTVVVVAAGNANSNAVNTTPANCVGTVTVAAVARHGGKAFYSNFGTVVDVAAPGGDQTAGLANGVLSTLNTGVSTPGADALAFYQGTSMATPHVAGAAALILSRNGALNPDQVESILKSTARAFPAACSQCGAGIVNAFAAVQAATGSPPPPPPPPSTSVPAAPVISNVGTTIFWAAVANATSYQLLYESQAVVRTVTGTSVVVPIAQCATASFSVTACNAAGCSAPSNSLTISGGRPPRVPDCS